MHRSVIEPAPKQVLWPVIEPAPKPTPVQTPFVRRMMGATTFSAGSETMAKVTGIGGIFFKSADQASSLEWYRKHLGIDAADWGGVPFMWRDDAEDGDRGYTVWSVFPLTTEHFPKGQDFMINYRVDDLVALVADLRSAGVEVFGTVEEHPNGKFAWIQGPDGRKVELWEPVPSKDDPYI